MTSPPQQPGEDGPDERADDQADRAGEQPVTADAAAGSQEPSDSEESAAGQPDQASVDDSSRDEDPDRSSEQDEPSERPEHVDADNDSEQNDREEAASDEPAEHASSSDEQTPPGEGEPGQDTAHPEPAGEAEQATAPKKKRTALIAGIAAAVVVVLVGGGVGAFFAFFAGNSAKEVAEQYVAVSTKETQNPGSVTAADYRPIVCKKSMPQVEKMQQRKKQVLKSVTPADLEKIKKVTTSLKKVHTNGDTGKATFETSFPGQPPQQAELQLMKEGGEWQLCG